MKAGTFARWCCLIGALNFGCDNDPVTPEPEPTPLNFYAFGQVQEDPVYWETTEVTPMEGSPGLSEVLDGAVSGDDVYVLGMIEDFSSHTPGYWKNGEIVKLPVGTSYEKATSILIEGSDVYAVGYAWTGDDEHTVAKYWRNGTAVDLPSGENGFAEAVGIAISGSDVHVIGWEDVRFKGIDSTYAVYWKNGERIKITPSARHDRFLELALKGNDVFIAGLTQDEGGVPHATVWKNGVPTRLTTGDTESVASQIVVIGDDIYAGGRNNKQAAYWKNGAMTTLETDASFASEINDMIEQDGDLIVSGWNYYPAFAYQGSFVWSAGKMHEPFTGNDMKLLVRGIAPKP